VVTPEAGLAARGAWLAAATAPLAEASRQTGALVVAGVQERSPAGDIAIAFAPDGSRRVYAKRHLLLPLEAQFTPGGAPGLLGAGMAMAICKDMDFPRTIRQDALAPAQESIRLMAVPAGDFVADGWLHGRMALMRGVENGFAVVRAAHQGLLTASDAQGRLIARTAAGPRGMDSIVADVPLGPGPTLYTRIGDVFPWASLALTLVLGAVAGLTTRRKDRSDNTVSERMRA
jgi:apolipoprotein N-acyltransferase